MDPRDPIAQAIDFNFQEGLQDPTRADTILKMLPRIMSNAFNPPQVEYNSGLPQTGQEAFADVGALAGQAPSGLPGDVKMGTNLGDIYRDRARQKLLADISNANQQGAVPERATQALNLLKMITAQQKPEEITLKPNELRMLKTPGGYQEVARGIQPEKVAEGLTPVPGAAGLFYDKRSGTPQVVDASGKPLSPPEIEAVLQGRKTPLVSIDMKNEAAYSTAGGKAAFDYDFGQLNAGRQAADSVRVIDRTIDLLKKGQAITGPLAEVRTIIEQAKQVVLRDKAAGKKVTDTQYLDSLLGSQVFPLIKQLGIGARGLDTPAEREFLRRVMTGTISLNNQTLLHMFERMRDDAKYEVDKVNTRIDNGELDRLFNTLQQPKQRITLPTGTTQPTEAVGQSNEDFEKQYNALPRGAQYVGPDGKTRTKQ